MDVNWVDLVQDKYQSRADVKIVMNFRFPWETDSRSRYSS
jgi:hypothetical protein